MGLRVSTQLLTIVVLAMGAGVGAGCSEQPPHGEHRGVERFPVPDAAAVAAEQRQELAEDLARAYGLAVDGQLEAARTVVNAYLARRGAEADTEQALFVLAVVQQRAGLNEQARALLEEVVARRPAFLSAYHHLGLSLCELGDLDGAREVFDVLRVWRPEQANTSYHLGLVALEQGRLDEAEALFRESIERFLDRNGRNPAQLARCYVGLGDVQQRRSELDAARENYERALASDALSQQAWYGLNRVLWRLGQSDTAEAAGREHARLVAAADIVVR